ncbi:hypothetical protein CKO27_05995 [Thiocystis violacea]|nr:hypothetical protein [Thiocystis violacea]
MSWLDAGSAIFDGVTEDPSGYPRSTIAKHHANGWPEWLRPLLSISGAGAQYLSGPIGIAVNGSEGRYRLAEAVGPRRNDVSD